MSAFGRECKNENIVVIRDCSELVSFMRTVTIKEEEDGGVIDLVCGGKWDEHFLKPAETKFVVRPPIG